MIPLIIKSIDTKVVLINYAFIHINAKLGNENILKVIKNILEYNGVLNDIQFNAFYKI